MKNIGKIIGISFVSLLAIVLVTVSVAVWIVFTPERFTPIVRKQADKFLSCKSEIGEVELTFFSTFPNFGLKIKQFALINPVPGSPSDTLIRTEELVGVIDAAAWWKRDEIILIGLELSGGYANIFSDSLGKTNYDIMPADTISPADTVSETVFPLIEIRNIAFNEVDINYVDNALKLNTSIKNMSGIISGTITNDSIGGIIKISKSEVSLEYEGEKYLNKALVQLDLPLDYIPSRIYTNIKNGVFSVNELGFSLNGSIMLDSAYNNITSDIAYSFSEWSVKNALALVPPSYNDYFKGIYANGLVSSEGTIKGIMNDSLMPLIELTLRLKQGVARYDGFPLPLHDIEGDLAIKTDLSSDALTLVRIKEFKAKTPLSAFTIEGRVDHLFSDISCDLTTEAGLRIDEFNQMIPDSFKIKMKGNISGKIKSVFSMSQIEKMQIEKMRLSGSVSFSDFSAQYDSISLITSLTKIDFSLPNLKASSGNTKFVKATITTDRLTSDKINSFSATLQKASFTMETSDARDTTRIPDVVCSFSMGSLSAKMDTMNLSIEKPFGKIQVSPVVGSPLQPAIILSYNSEQLKTAMGQNSFSSDRLNLETDIKYDNTQKDIFLQWIVKGFIDMNRGIVTVSGLSNPIEIPILKMDFEPEKFNIKDSKMIIDKSDFRLTGTLTNILSYFRGDSILKGDFSFVSNTTDVSQLMALTNGIGNEDSTAVEKPEIQDTVSSNSGPYMVPKNVDLFLTTNIRTATFGPDTASNIIGSVQVHDGILVLDGLSFKTPAAKMQLTAMYRTPRKNHLFLGLDFHMLDIEIEELLTMIPDIDSLMPMLRSFKGKGEFHIAVETYLDSLYNLKKSTLRGASSIRGNNLVLMDGETFTEIAKKLMFSKKTENKVDSLSAEFTIFRNEIDIYPFLIVLDKYKAVIAGRHNFDMSYNYHISVVDNPLPVKLGIDVLGTETDLKYNLVKCKYAELYRPSSRKVVESKQIELRKLIREALTQKVKN